VRDTPIRVLDRIERGPIAGDAASTRGIRENLPDMTGVTAILVRELRLSVRHGADTLAALLFFLLIVSLFPFAIGPAPETLGRMAPGRWPPVARSSRPSGPASSSHAC